MAFSIVIPLWNKRHAVAATVASVLDQTYRDFELVIVDDGSTDGSMDALRGFDDPRIRRIAQANAGPGAARNRGIEESRHDWIAFLDADDIWSPDHLAELGRLRLEHPQAGLIGTSYLVPEWDGCNHLPRVNESRIEIVDYFERLGQGKRLFCASSAAIPKRTYVDLGGFVDGLAGQDSEYWARIALDRPVAFSSRTTAVYRRGIDGLSTKTAAAELGVELRHARDLGPVVALLMERYPTIRCRDMRNAIDRYVDFRFRLCVRTAARIGDFRTLRALPGVYLRPPRLPERLILALALMPQPLARGVYGLGFKARALLRLLKRTSRIFEKGAGQAPPWPTQFNLKSDGHED
jgi:glycosyltransferase involved in cell wall biosynthesis